MSLSAIEKKKTNLKNKKKNIRGLSTTHRVHGKILPNNFAKINRKKIEEKESEKQNCVLFKNRNNSSKYKVEVVVTVSV